MSVADDLLKLVEELWDIEQFNMWNPQEHSALAYLLDGAIKESDYQEKYDKWFSLAQEKKFNEFAWEISKGILDVAKADTRFTASARASLEEAVKWQKDDYQSNCLSGFGIVREEYIPDWFFIVFDGYMQLKEIEKKDAIVEYCIKECAMTEKDALETYQVLNMHYDLLNELYFYVQNKRFLTFEPITVEGISAQQLSFASDLSPVDAYKFLIFLREYPEEAIEILKECEEDGDMLN